MTPLLVIRIFLTHLFLLKLYFHNSNNTHHFSVYTLRSTQTLKLILPTQYFNVDSTNLHKKKQRHRCLGNFPKNTQSWKVAEQKFEHRS